MEPLQEFGIFLCVWAAVMLVVAVGGKRIARHLRSMGLLPPAVAGPRALQPARALMAPPGKEIQG